MSRRELLLSVMFGLGLLAMVATLVYKRVYLPRTCSQREAVKVSDVAVLVEELQSAHACIRSRAALDLQKVGRGGEPAVPYLLKTIEDKDDSVRWRSVAALGYIGVFTEEVEQAAIRHIHDSNPTARINSIFALGRMRSQGAVKGLLTAFDDQSPENRWRAAQDLSWSIDYSRDKEIIPEIIERLEALQSDPVEKVRQRASETLSIVRIHSAGPESNRVAGANFTKGGFLLKEFDSLHKQSDRNPVRRSGYRRQKKKFGLAAQYQELEKGIKLLGEKPTSLQSSEFLCWLRKGFSSYKFRNIVFRDDLKQLESLARNPVLAENDCLDGAVQKIKEVLGKKSYSGMSFECPFVSLY